jgi:hypothetical protein
VSASAIPDVDNPRSVQERWLQLVKPSLVAAHKAAGRGPSAQTALMQLAEEPAFLALSTHRMGAERGRAVRDWLIARVAEVTARTTDPASHDALEDWLTYLATGEKLRDVPAASGRRARGETLDEIRYRMGLYKVSPAHASFPAVAALVAAATAGSAIDLDDPAVAAASTFARARPLLQHAGLGRTLLLQLIGLPDEPVPVAALETLETRGPLLADVRAAVRQTGRPILQAARGLESLGMLETRLDYDERTVRLKQPVRLLAHSLFTPAELAQSGFSGLRWLLRVAPGSPEDPAEWRTWAWLLPHVVALVNDPELEGRPKKHLDRIGKLANLASVYARFKVADADLSTRLGRRGMRLLQLAGIPDPETYSAALVNLSAVASSSESVQLTAAAVDERRRTLGRDDPVLIGTYLAEANALDRDGQRKDAQAKFEWLVREIEEVHAEVMNDYGVFLLGQHERAPHRGFADQAEEFCSRACSSLRPWAHGWFRANLNWARAQLAAGKTGNAERQTRQLLDETRRRFGTHTPEVLDVLDVLLDVADVTQPPDREDLLDEAFRIDDQIMIMRGDYESGRA